MKALVVHTRRTGLGIIRSLGKKGVKVYAADEYKSPGFFSKFVDKGFVIPDINACDEHEFIESMEDIGSAISQEEKVFLFTSSDDYLVMFSKYWDLLDPYFISISETNHQRLLDNLAKDKMYKMAEQANVNYPKTYYSDDINVKKINYPVVIKPSIRKSSEHNIGKSLFKIRKCQDTLELKGAIQLLEDNDSKYVVQEYIEGEDDQLYTVGLFAYKGEVIASASARKLRQFPPSTGECSFGELTHDPAVLFEAEKYINASGITGMCQIEFKKSGKRYYLMEINPRPWSWNSLIEYSGVNLPFIACKTLSNPDDKKSYGQSIFKGSWVFSLMDLKYHYFLNKNISFLTFLKNVFFSNRHAYFDYKDPVPVIVALFQFVKSPQKSLQKRST